jgi:hypothetical protein
MNTLLLASLTLPAARQLAETARARRWGVHALDEVRDDAPIHFTGPRTFYGGTDRAAAYAAQFDLCLIEPPLDLIVRVPADLLCRRVRFGTIAELVRDAAAATPVFAKPADPIQRSFDAGVYRGVAEIRGRRPLDPHTQVLLADPVEWTAEFRCFIREGTIGAWSPYFSFGRPAWKPHSAATTPTPATLTTFCERLYRAMANDLPPAFVVDIGALEDGRWAVVEFNPAWCSGLLGASVDGALRVIERAAMWWKHSPADRRWSRRLRPGGSSI